MAKTDWDSYYNKPAPTASITRKISERRIIGLLQTFVDFEQISICEIGGGNSCMVDAICAALPVVNYHIIDLNDYGLELLNNRSFLGKVVTWERADITNLEIKDKMFDLVFSVGLVEHFDPADTAIAIKSHFQLCKNGGCVFITYPTPTLLYRGIRSLAERLGVWDFPDERPLLFSEVFPQIRKGGSIIHHSINYWIGLTQEYVLARKY